MARRLVEEEARGDVGLALTRDDDAGVLVVEAVLGEAHEGSVLVRGRGSLRARAS